MMKMTRLAAVIVLTVIASIAHAGGVNILFVLEPGMDDSELVENTEFMGSFVQQAGDNSVAAIMQDGQKIFSFSGEGNQLKRRKAQNLVISQLRAWYDRQRQLSQKAEADVAGGLRRAFERANADSKASRHVVVMLSSGIHRDKNVSFEGTYPSDSWANPNKPSAFAAIPKVSGNVEVVFVTSPGDYADTNHELKLRRFYDLLLNNRKARLIAWVDSRDVAAEYIRNGNPVQMPAVQAVDFDGKLILYKMDCSAEPEQQSLDTEEVTVRPDAQPLETQVLSLTADQEKVNMWVIIDGPQTIPIERLGPKNFVVYQKINGIKRKVLPEEITMQPKESQHMSVVLLRDVSQSMEEGSALEDSARGIMAFIDLMQPGDAAALVNFHDRVWVVKDFCTSKIELKNAVQPPSETGGTALYMALWQGIKMLENRPGRKLLLAYTDGAETKFNIKHTDVINAALKAGIPICMVGLGLVVEDFPKTIAKDSGGLYFYSPTAADMVRIYRHISKVLENSVSISFPNSAATGDKVEVDGLVEVEDGKDFYQGKFSSETTVR